MASILVSEAEKVYVLHGVQEDLRCDGRGRKDVRPIVVETDIGNRYFYLIFFEYPDDKNRIMYRIICGNYTLNF